ncbi:hypothetical protein ACP4OV_005451 [Aristida adscensionis]
MAISPSILPLAIVGVSIAGIVTIVAIIALYECAKIAMKMVQKEYDDRRRSPDHDHEASATSDSGDTSSGEAATGVEAGAGSMTRFLEGIEKERPVRFSSRQLRGFTGSYARKVGAGGFGVVYKGRFPDGTPVAVKVLGAATLGRRAEEQFMAEVGSIGRTHHVNLHGSLDGYLFDPPPEKAALRFGKLHEIAVGTARALRYLHEECARRIIHYDIKPQNVLLAGAGGELAAKVSDFGLARLCDREDTHLTVTGARGTPGYAAPELWTPQPVTHKCDVYSYGMLLFEVLGRRRNLELGRGESESREWYPRWVWRRLEAGDMGAAVARAGCWDGGEREKAERACKVALWCVQYRPEERPSMGSVVRMLEGDDHIAAPPNPFAHLAPYAAAPEPPSGDTAMGTYASPGLTLSAI